MWLRLGLHKKSPSRFWICVWSRSLYSNQLCNGSACHHHSHWDGSSSIPHLPGRVCGSSLVVFSCSFFFFFFLFKKLQSGTWMEAFRPQVAVLANFWCWQEILYSIKKAMSVHYVSREAILHYTQRKKLCSGLTTISCQDYSCANSNRTTAVW